MNMGLVTNTNRHTAFDSTVVFHEFTHSLTTRLVGGPQNIFSLDAPQSNSMGEGWGDYTACIINNVTVVGA
jgi:extracellular elastinolytic metalloproteinase